VNQTTYWFLADGSVRVRPLEGEPREAADEEVRQALEALPLTTFKPVQCEGGT
jgi:hypothetical protein